MLCCRARNIPALVLAFGFAWSPAGSRAQDIFQPPTEAPGFEAVAAEEPMEIDGRLVERTWSRARPITDFVQKDPSQGEPASYRTEVLLAYDASALYVAAVCYQPRSSLRVQNLERDFSNEENDLFGIAIDGFLDQRNAVAFQTTPYGNQRDLEVIDGSEINTDWDARWDVRTRIEDDRWVVEMAIPWRTLRYPTGADRLGVILARNVRSLNEYTSAPAVPRALTIYRMAYQAEIGGIETPQPTANVQINPYVRVEQTDADDSDPGVEFGGELKWAISPSTVLDLTVNTDFAQADVDRAVINFDRFSVFFPENANIFNASVTDWIRPFFSRRIGLDDDGQPIPLSGGVRLTRRSASQDFGILAMQQERQATRPASLFGVARYSRNVGSQSRLGGMFTWRRDETLHTPGGSVGGNDNYTYTVDGLWRASQSAGIQAMVSASHDGREGNGLGAQFWAFYENNGLYAGWLEYYNKDYEPGMGLEILDTNYVMHSPAVSLDLRSDWLPPYIRSFNPSATAYVFQSSDSGDLLFGYVPLVPARFHFQNGAQVGIVVEPNWQRLEQPFAPVGIEIAAGRYDYTRYRLELSSDQSATLSGSLDVETGDYFDGELTTYTLAARYAPTPHFELSADIEFSEIRGLGVLDTSKHTSLYGLSVRLALNPRLQFTSYHQRNDADDRDIWNARIAWEFRPLSYLYLVYNRNDQPDAPGAFAQPGEQLIAKLTYLFEI